MSEQREFRGPCPSCGKGLLLKLKPGEEWGHFTVCPRCFAWLAAPGPYLVQVPADLREECRLLFPDEYARLEHVDRLTRAFARGGHPIAVG